MRFFGLQQTEQKVNDASRSFVEGRWSVWSAEFMRRGAGDDLSEFTGTVQVDRIVSGLIEMKESVSIASNSVAKAKAFD